jgi:hypothetical protein
MGHLSGNVQWMSGFSSLKLRENVWTKDTDLGCIGVEVELSTD